MAFHLKKRALDMTLHNTLVSNNDIIPGITDHKAIICNCVINIITKKLKTISQTTKPMLKPFPVA